MSTGALIVGAVIVLVAAAAAATGTEVNDNPVLIERPIVVAEDGRVALGRPPEAVLEIL